METVKVIGEYRRFAQPLSVDFAPECLTPAGVGYGEVDAFGVDLVPMPRSHDVTQGIGVIVFDHFGISGGAGAEKDQHGIR